MIRVKKTKASEDQTDPSQPYKFEDKKPLSGLPQAIGLVVMSIAFYLRSTFASPFHVMDGGGQSGRPHRGNQDKADPTDDSLSAPDRQHDQTGQDREIQDDPSPKDHDIMEVATFFRFSDGANVVPLFQKHDAPLHGDASKHAVSFEQDRSQLWDGPAFNPRSFGQPSSGQSDSAFIPSEGLKEDDETPLDKIAEQFDPEKKADASDETTSETLDETPYLPSDTVDGQDAEEDDQADDRNGPNRAPIRQRSVYLTDLFGTSAVLISLGSLLEHVTDPDGDLLFVQDLTASSGTVVATSEGYYYTPDAQYAGAIQFAYTVSDGQASVAQMAHFSVLATLFEIGQTLHVVSGTSHVDKLTGTDGADEIDGLAGNDIIEGGVGDDLVFGDAGDDLILGGMGADTIFGGAGKDRINGGGGDDEIHGGSGDDVLSGDGGNDEIAGDEGDDILLGGAGDDHLDGGDGQDLMDGGTSDDLIADGAGNDIVYGGAGSDVVYAAIDGSDDEFHGDQIDPPLTVKETQGPTILPIPEEGTDLRQAVDYSPHYSRAQPGTAAQPDQANISEIEADSTADNTGAVLAATVKHDNNEEGTADLEEEWAENEHASDHTPARDAADTADNSAEHRESLRAETASSPVNEHHSASGATPEIVEIDTLDYSDDTTGIKVDLGAGTVDGAETGHDSFDGFELFVSSSGNDDIFGSDQADNVADGAGQDTVALEDGDDVLLAALDMDEDEFDGGDGIDTLDLSQHTSDLVIDIEDGVYEGPETARDHFLNFEVVVLGSGDDDIEGSQRNDVVVDGAGQDTVALEEGDDTLRATPDMDEDEFDGGDGIDTLDLSQNTSDLVIDIEDGTYEGIETATDHFSGFEAYVAGAGNDTVIAKDDVGGQSYDGQDGEDALDLSHVSEQLLIDMAAGVIKNTDGGLDKFEDFEAIVGTINDDVFIIGGKRVELTGGDGDDRYEFGNYEDIFAYAASIKDFSVGDKIKTRKLYFSEKAEKDSDYDGLHLAVKCDDDSLDTSVVSFSYGDEDGHEVTHFAVQEDDIYSTFITLKGHFEFTFDAH